MNKLQLLLLSILLVGCAGHQIDRKIANQNDDLLHNESFFRFNENRLDKAIDKKSDHEIALLCHSDNNDDGIALAKDNYLKDKDNASHWIQLSTCFFKEFNLVKSEYFLQYAGQLAKSRKQKAIIENNLGVIELHLRHYKDAEGHFLMALKHDSRALTPTFNLLQMDLQFGRIESARKKVVAFEKFAPTDPDILAAKAVIYLQQGQFKMAENTFMSIPKEMRLREDIALNYALTLFMDKKYQKALDLLNQKDLAKISLLEQSGKLLKNIILKEMQKIEDQKRARQLNRKLASNEEK